MVGGYLAASKEARGQRARRDGALAGARSRLQTCQDSNAPAELFVRQIVFHATAWPLELDDLRQDLEAAEQNFRDHEQAACSMAGEEAEKQALRNQV